MKHRNLRWEYRWVLERLREEFPVAVFTDGLYDYESSYSIACEAPDKPRRRHAWRIEHVLRDKDGAYAVTGFPEFASPEEAMNNLLESVRGFLAQREPA